MIQLDFVASDSRGSCSLPGEILGSRTTAHQFRIGGPQYVLPQDGSWKLRRCGREGGILLEIVDVKMQGQTNLVKIALAGSA